MTPIDHKARHAAARAIAATHPHMVPVWDVGHGGAMVAAVKNIRVELRAVFPGVKFSVKSERHSSGDSIDVHWIDGPTTGQVDAIIGRYAAGHFDGMDDSYRYARDAWRDAFGDAQYVHSSRDISERAADSALRTLRARGVPVPAEATGAAFKVGRLWYRCGPPDAPWPAEYFADQGEMLQTLVYREASRRTWCISHPLPAPREVAP